MASYIPVLPLASRNADVTSRTYTVWEKYQAAHVVVNITSGSPNLTVYVKGVDTVSNGTYTILQSATISASGITVLKIGPEYTAGANVARDYIPYNFEIDVTQSGNVAATYSIGMSLF